MREWISALGQVGNRLSSARAADEQTSTGAAADRLGRTLDSLVRLASSRRLHQRQASAADATISQQGFRLLRMVAERGPITPTELARLTDIDPAVVTRQSRLLESDGLVTRTRDDGGDGRVSSLAVTDHGKRTVLRMRKVLNRHMQLALRAWSDRDVEVLADLMDRLVSDLRAIPYPELPST